MSLLTEANPREEMDLMGVKMTSFGASVIPSKPVNHQEEGPRVGLEPTEGSRLERERHGGVKSRDGHRSLRVNKGAGERWRALGDQRLREKM